MSRWVTGLFRTRALASNAVDALLRHGYTREDVSMLMSEDTHRAHFGVETGNKAAEGAGVGGAVGATAGAVAAAIAAIGTSLVIPGLGLIIAGPLAAGLAGAGAGAATGGLVGAMVGAGIPEHRAKLYDAGLREGGILVGVKARSSDDADRVEKVLDDLGASSIKQ
jgi:hypothetical protein